MSQLHYNNSDAHNFLYFHVTCAKHKLTYRVHFVQSLSIVDVSVDLTIVFGREPLCRTVQRLVPCLFLAAHVNEPY